MKKLSKKKNTNKMIMILFIISCPFLTILLSNRYSLMNTIVGAFFSFIIAIIIGIKYIYKKKFNNKIFIISTLLSLYIIKFYISIENKCINQLTTIIKKQYKINLGNNNYIIFAFLAFFSFSIFIYFFIEKIVPIIKKFLKGLSKTEKKYLIIILVIGAIVSYILPYITSAFFIPNDGNKTRIYDVIYTSDTGAIVKYDAYFNVSYDENDIRQPLFGVFALPISITGKILSLFILHKYSYIVAMTFLQFILLSLSIIMIARMLKIKEKEKKWFYLIISLTFPYLLFSILLEQYVISLSYLIITCYIFFETKFKKNYMYVGSVGTMIISGVLIPMISKTKKISQIIYDILKCFYVFVAFTVISGQLPQLFIVDKTLNRLLTNFARKLTFNEKLYQFTYFIKSSFIGPKGFIREGVFTSYQLLYPSHLSKIGVAIFIVAIIGFILNRKNKFAQFCLGWIFLSIIVLLIIGWGTTENGLILYSLYFSFAYVSLIYLFLRRIIKNNTLFTAAIISISFIILILNLSELYNIFSFAIKYY